MLHQLDTCLLGHTGVCESQNLEGLTEVGGREETSEAVVGDVAALTDMQDLEQGATGQ